jgi:hypothetical protein
MKDKRESQWQDLMVLLYWLLELMNLGHSCSKQIPLEHSFNGKQELLAVEVKQL